MDRMRLVPIGLVSDTPLCNLAAALTSKQDFYDFTVSSEPMPITCAPAPDKTYDEDDLHAALVPFSAKHYPDEFPIGVCNVPLTDQLSTCFDGRAGLISVHGWKDDYPGVPLSKLLAYNFIDILLTRHVDVPPHEDTRGCFSDFCDSRPDRLSGLSRCEFCNECKGLIVRAMRNGEITLHEVAALERIMDYVAGRKRAFVLMPFAPHFDQVYRGGIKPALESLGWICQRADEVHRAREILDLIWEGIHVADLVVADLTGQNPNVFYEVGYAQALGRSTVLLTQDMNDVPFDLRSHQVVHYDAAESDWALLAEKLSRYVADE